MPVIPKNSAGDLHPDARLFFNRLFSYRRHELQNFLRPTQYIVSPQTQRIHLPFAWKHRHRCDKLYTFRDTTSYKFRICHAACENDSIHLAFQHCSIGSHFLGCLVAHGPQHLLSIAVTPGNSLLNSTQKHPDAKFYIDLEQHSCTREEIAAINWDMIFTWENNFRSVTSYYYRELMHTKEYIIISTNHPLSRKTNLKQEDFIGEAFCYTWINSLSVKSHIDYTYSLSDYRQIPLPNIASVLAHVQSGLAFTILETSILPFLQFEYRTVLLERERIMAYGWKNDKKKPLLKKFVQTYQQQLCSSTQTLPSPPDTPS